MASSSSCHRLSRDVVWSEVMSSCLRVGRRRRRLRRLRRVVVSSFEVCGLWSAVRCPRSAIHRGRAIAMSSQRPRTLPDQAYDGAGRKTIPARTPAQEHMNQRLANRRCHVESVSTRIVSSCSAPRLPGADARSRGRSINRTSEGGQVGGGSEGGEATEARECRIGVSNLSALWLSTAGRVTFWRSGGRAVRPRLQGVRGLRRLDRVCTLLRRLGLGLGLCAQAERGAERCERASTDERLPTTDDDRSTKTTTDETTDAGQQPRATTTRSTAE